MGFENQITKEAIKDVDDTLQIMKDRPDADMRMQECKTSQDRIVCKGKVSHLDIWSLKVTMFLRVHVDNLIHGTPPEIHVILKFGASDFNQQHKINRVTLSLACLHHYIITSSGAYHSFSFLSVEILCRDSFWHSVTGCRSSFQRCCRDKRCQWRQIRALPCSVYSVARLVQERFS